MLDHVQGNANLASPRADRVSLYSDNRLKLGLFGANCSSGRAVTTVPERWSGSWRDNLRLAQMADAAGIEFMLPIGRWKGYGGKTNYQGATFETVTWASGLLAATKRLTVFGTVHAPLLHPIVAAKEFVTADHIGEGRFGLNVVCGWNEDEFTMFGATMQDHERRYEYAQEWVDIVKLAWTQGRPFDFDGKHIRLKDVLLDPKPFGGTAPIMMNAGASAVGQAFAIRNCDALFSSASLDSLDVTSSHVRDIKTRARQNDSAIGVFTVGVVSCRPNAKDAADYYRHCIVDNGDWDAVDHILAMRKITAATHSEAELQKHRLHTAHGLGGLPLVGDPDMVVDILDKLVQAGLQGIAISFTNYIDELPFFCDEVLPRLVRKGLRVA